MAHPPELDLDLIRVRAEQDNNGSPIDLPRPTSPSTDEVIVRADEVDETTAERPQRPILRREGSAPPPPPRQPPPPAPPAQEDCQGSESLSIARLRDIATSLPKLEPKAYDYSYRETRTLAEELEEWFQYTEEDRDLLKASKEAYSQKFEKADFNGGGSRETSWVALPLEDQESFVSHLTLGLLGNNLETRKISLLAITYIALGTWLELDGDNGFVDQEDDSDFAAPNNKYRKAAGQLKAIKKAAELLCRLGAIKHLCDLVQDLCNQ